jgi:hypothetical protein
MRHKNASVHFALSHEAATPDRWWPHCYSPAMKQYRPLIASLVVIAVAMGGLAAWRFAGQPAKRGPASNNAPAPGNAAPTDPSGLEYVTVPLEPLPELDPLGLWPRDAQGIAAAQFWVMWETTEFSRCRLLVTRNQRDWHDLGSTAGKAHYLPVNFGDFDSQLSFAVEFEARGKRYRSRPRSVKFARGTAFARREMHLKPGNEPMATHQLELIGGGGGLSQENFRSYFFPEDLQPFVIPGSSGAVMFGVGSPGAIPAAGCAGFIEVFDPASVTSDRMLIQLSR